MEINITNERYSDRLICPNCNNEINANCYNTSVFEEDVVYGELCQKCNKIIHFKVKTIVLFNTWD